jgi:hypothetical protein
MTAHGLTDPRAAARRLLATGSEFAEVRGAHVPALLPPTWQPAQAGPA